MGHFFTPSRANRYEHSKRIRKDRRRRVYAKKGIRVQPPETFLGMPCVKVDFTIPTKEERRAVRREFEMKARANFLKFLAETQVDQLRAAGITNKQIKEMQQGKTPNGFNTHHKLSVYGGGTNDFSNLLLIRRRPYHDMMHYHLINPQVQGMSTGQTREVVIPNPSDYVYVPAEEFRHLERDAKRGQKSYGQNREAYRSQMNKKEAPFMDDVKKADAYVRSQMNNKKRGR